MHDVLLVQVDQRRYNLLDDLTHSLDIHFTLQRHRLQILLEVAAFAKLDEDMELLLPLPNRWRIAPNEVLVVDDAGMLETAPNSEFLVHHAEVFDSHPFVIMDLDHLVHADTRLAHGAQEAPEHLCLAALPQRIQRLHIDTVAKPLIQRLVLRLRRIAFDWHFPVRLDYICLVDLP